MDIHTLRYINVDIWLFWLALVYKDTAYVYSNIKNIFSSSTKHK